MTTYTFEEVKKHNTKESAWLVIHNDVYDITDFLNKHPGGYNMVIAAAGLDATILYESYHLDMSKPNKLLNKYKIGSLEKPNESYYEFNKSKFYPTLKKRVLEKLQQLDRPRRGPIEIYIKAVCILVTLIASWYVGFIQAGYGSNLLAFGLAIIHGMAAAQVGLSIMHDGNHGALSNSGTVNKAAGMGMDLIGASGITWQAQHVLGHHAYTNLETKLEGVDNDDLETKHIENDPDVFSSYPLVRMHKSDGRDWYHKYQYIYAPLLFSIFTMSKVYISDIDFYLNNRVQQISMEPLLHSFMERARFLFFKMLNFTLLVIIPSYLHGIGFALGMLCAAHAVCGEYLGIAFIVNHVTDIAEFFTGGDIADADKKDDGDDSQRDWAMCQARSTVDWSVDSFFWNHATGGLNAQLVHHLFPGLCHVNYPYVIPEIRQTCKEFGITYNELPTFYQAIRHMILYLKALGEEDTPETGAFLNEFLDTTAESKKVK